MQLKKGAAVESSTGEKIGRLGSVVLDHETKEVSHIIIEKGLLLTTNKVVYIQDVRTVEDDGRIILYKTAQELEEAPTYDPDSYVHLNQEEPSGDVVPQERVDSVLWYPPVNTPWWGGGSGTVSYPQPKFKEGKDLFPEEDVVLKEGSKVISTDGKTVGTVAQVIMDRPTRTATHIVISAGLFLKEEKLVPTLWVREVKEDEVRLSVSSDIFDDLPHYEHAKPV